MIEEHPRETRPLRWSDYAHAAIERMEQNERELRPAVVQALAFLVCALGALFIWRTVPNPDAAIFIAGVLALVALVHVYNVMASR